MTHNQFQSKMTITFEEWSQIVTELDNLLTRCADASDNYYNKKKNYIGFFDNVTRQYTDYIKTYLRIADVRLKLDPSAVNNWKAILKLERDLTALECDCKTVRNQHTNTSTQ